MIKFINTLIKNRNLTANKGDFGRALVIAGSKKYPGAAFIASNFAELSGPGYLALACPESIYLPSLNNISYNSIHEILSQDDDFNYKDDTINILNKYDSILFGNGINISLSNEEFLKYLLRNYKGTLILDGSALQILAQNINILNDHLEEQNIILLPHLGEARALFKSDIKSRHVKDYYLLAQEFCYKYKLNILLKSYSSSLILANKEIYESKYMPSPFLAKAGSGDALAGLMCGFFAYALKYFTLKDIVLNVDAIFHEAAHNVEKKYSVLNCDAINLKEEVLHIICKVSKG